MSQHTPAPWFHAIMTLRSSSLGKRLKLADLLVPVYGVFVPVVDLGTLEKLPSTVSHHGVLAFVLSSQVTTPPSNSGVTGNSVMSFMEVLEHSSIPTSESKTRAVPTESWDRLLTLWNSSLCRPLQAYRHPEPPGAVLRHSRLHYRESCLVRPARH